MDSNAAKGALLGRPAEFLKYYPLKCAGAKAPLQNQVNLKPIYIHKQDGAYITDPKTHKAKIGIMGHRRHPAQNARPRPQDLELQAQHDTACR